MSLRDTSKFLSLLLRHKPQLVGLELDEHGWAEVDDLIARVSRKRPLDRATLEQIVATDDKQRYSFSADGKLIRDGKIHAVEVELDDKTTIRRESLNTFDKSGNFKATTQNFFIDGVQLIAIPKNRNNDRKLIIL